MNYEIDYQNLIKENNMSKLWKLDWLDILNGLLFAVLGNVVFYLLQIFTELFDLVMNKQPFEIYINFKAVLVVTIFSALTYLSKRFLSNSEGVVFGKNV